MYAAPEQLGGPPLANQQAKWEQGTLNLESTAGVEACIKYIAGLGVRFGKGK